MAGTIIFLGLWIAAVATDTSLAFVHLPVSDKEADLHIQVQHESRYRGKRSNDEFPHSLQVNVTIDGENRHVPLERNYDVTDDVPVLMMRSGSVRKYRFDSKQRVAFYSNRETGASFMAWTTNSTNNSTTTGLDLFGTFQSGGHEYLIQPPRGPNRRHTVTEVPETHPVFADFTLNEDPLRQRSRLKAATERRRKRQTAAYQVEILFVIDNSLYNFWYDTTVGEADRNAATVEYIKQFYAFVLNAIDVRYQSVTGRTFTIRCVYAGIFIADTLSSASYIEDHVFDYGTTKGFLADDVLSAFASWAEANLAPSMDYDHGMMFTSYEMGRNTTGTFSNSTAGFAYVGEVCTTLKYSINEDKFQANMATVAAHELGHNLGASHDEDGNACFAADGYIMAPSSGASTDYADNLRLWVFSSCSMDYFEANIDTLGSANCMTTINSSDTAGLDAYSSEHAGQMYPPDVQCEQVQGPGSYMFRGYYDGDYSTFCGVMTCSSAANDGSYYFYIPWEGSTCGNGSVCQSGSCVAEPDAPMVDDDTCVFGDVPYNVFGQTQTCAEFLGTDATSYQCYQSAYRKSCCATCAMHKLNNLNYTGCEYGDKHVACATISLSQCYSSTNEGICCKFCNRNRLNIPNCEYGDKATGCDVNSCPYYPPESLDLCCQTCAPDTTTSTSTLAITTTPTATSTLTSSTSISTSTGITTLPVTTTTSTSTEATTLTSATTTTTAAATSTSSASTALTTTETIASTSTAQVTSESTEATSTVSTAATVPATTSTSTAGTMTTSTTAVSSTSTTPTLSTSSTVPTSTSITQTSSTLTEPTSVTTSSSSSSKTTSTSTMSSTTSINGGPPSTTTSGSAGTSSDTTQTNGPVTTVSIQPTTDSAASRGQFSFVVILVLILFQLLL